MGENKKTTMDKETAQKLRQRIISLTAENQQEIWELYKKKYVDNSTDPKEESWFDMYFGREYHQYKISRLLKRLNIDKSNNIFYEVVELEGDDWLMYNWLLPEIKDLQLGKAGTVLIISVTFGKETYLCEMLNKCLKPNGVALIPAYGSVVLIGKKSEVERINNAITELKNKVE